MQHLTIQQQNIWNLRKYYPMTAITNICGSITFHNSMDIETLIAAIRHVIKIQGALRLRFDESAGEPMQEEIPEDLYNIQSLCFESEDDFHRYAELQAKKPFLLNQGPMGMITVAEFDNRTAVLICVDHLIADAWTVSLLAKQVYSAYQTISSRELPETDSSYTYAQAVAAEDQYLASKAFERDRKYWAEQYTGAPEPSSVRPETLSATNPDAKRFTSVIDSELAAQILSFEKETGYSPAIVFEAAMAIYLSRINRENRNAAIGLTVLNRRNYLEQQTAGMFVSTVPMQIECPFELPVSKLLDNLAAKHMGIFRHQRYPYSLIAQDIHERFQTVNRLYEVVVSYQNAQTDVPADTRWYFSGYCEVPLEIHVDQRDQTGLFRMNIDYQTEIFSDREIELLKERLLTVVKQIVTGKDLCVKDVMIMAEEEKNILLHEFNCTAGDFPDHACVHELFRNQAANTPDRTALVFRGRKISYHDLDQMSDALAAYLRAQGIGRGCIVPIISKRSWHIPVAMIGILKSGAAYMPVDPTFPKDRIREMISVAHADFALVYDYDIDLGIHTVSMADVPLDTSFQTPVNMNDPDDICYVIFTSGSTGKPKGIALSHKNVANFTNKNACFSDDVHSIVSVTNIIFDIFVTESLLPLINGMTVYFADDDEAVSQKHLSKLINENPVDAMQTTPTKMRSLIADKTNRQFLAGLKMIILGGEALPEDLARELMKESSAKIFNIYGPAETTVWSTSGEVTDPGNITIGKPIANTQIYILDDRQRMLPLGVAGELCVAGEGVGKGYLNRADLTAERFIPNPYAAKDNGHGQIMYRTGDLARWREDGEIEYLGRIDTQVKIRGLRIELSEIESVMAGYPGIRLTAVTDKRDETGRQYLVGYYTGESVIDETELRKYLSKTLPRYMVPNYFMRLETMPMTASGKTDRKNLPVPEFTAAVHEYVAPENEKEAALCHVLEELFQLERFGTTDDFFEMGGDSLRAIEYVAKAHAQGVDFSLQNVFDYPTVRALSAYIDSSKDDNTAFDLSEFDKYESILRSNVINDDWQPQKRSLGDTLLTGGTGFLGAHIIDEYLKAENGILYCLVRGSEERLKDALHYYFDDRYDDMFGKRIRCIIGDITDDNLDDFIPKNIKTVIHAAASVKHFGSYEYFRKINTEGTAKIAGYAAERNARLIHISTVSVSGNTFGDAFDIFQGEKEIDFDETCFYCEQPLTNVYVRSKFEAERAVMDAMMKGLDAKIIRIGNLTNRTSDLKFQPNYQSNAFLTRVKAALELGYLPDYLLDSYAELSPVDQTAEGIILIAEYADSQTVFHLNSNKGLYFRNIYTMLNSLGIRMNIISGNEFNQLIQTLVKKQETRYIYEAFQNDLDENGNLAYDGNIHIINDFTVWFMKKIGFEWTEIDQRYLSGYISYFRSLGYFSK